MMKSASTVALTLVGGLHCASAGVDGGAEEADVATSAAGIDREQQRPLPLEAPEQTGSFAGADLEGNASSKVTSTAVADDGSRYLAGVFSGSIRAGDVILRSRGGDDVFVLHVHRDGTVVWAKAVGSEGAESDPRITFERGRLKLVAMTTGAVDCGFGPLRTWSSETFFLCTFDARGTPQSGGAFPTGRP